ncbi:autophagy protein [Niveomyces insectorum RCEF 264]|uniref:Autophagy-related protein 27 n=1 Tax=Niveomyces insectorum RCEF 264 TaxID=1081102 RepID=A0A167QH69_9HYPO|nr:autophagy protein [Niveomyces insectorum RCEF 264]
MKWRSTSSLLSSSSSSSSFTSSSSPSSPMLLLIAGLAVVASAPPAAAMLSCDRVLADGHMFDFSPLRGPHSVVTAQHTPPTEQNVTYTLDLCGQLKRKGDVPKGEECPNGSWACAIKRWRAADGSTGIGQVIPLAGNLENHGGGPLDYKATRLKTADAHGDAEREGVRLVLQGGRYPLDGPVKARQNQRVVVELVCDPNLEGTEGEWGVEEYEGPGPAMAAARAAGGVFAVAAAAADMTATATAAPTPAPNNPVHPGETQLTRPDDPPALVFQGYDEHDADGAVGTLRLTWSTKYACENVAGGRREHWGFFTWFVILVFLGTAAYLIFGSWLNYNRYGARGWDLVPHSDTLRDVPYLLQDWVRRLINTLQGSGSRGGYSAV